MSAFAVVVFHVRKQKVPQVPLADHHDMVEAFSADRADQPLRIAILPKGNGLIVDAQRSHATNEHLTITGISISDQVIGYLAPNPQASTS